MPSNQSEWYAAQEFISRLQSGPLRCPRCQKMTQQFEMKDSPENPRLKCGICSELFTAADFRADQERRPNTGLSTLYRPIGEAELSKISAMEFRRFPPRLFWQPIFYPVLTLEYAAFIAREWNSTDSDHHFIGYVTRFQVRNEFLCHYEIHTASDKHTLEYWIPAEELDQFNDQIVGTIDVIQEYRNGVLFADRSSDVSK